MTVGEWLVENSLAATGSTALEMLRTIGGIVYLPMSQIDADIIIDEYDVIVQTDLIECDIIVQELEADIIIDVIYADVKIIEE
jgi:hypothetical protein